MELILIANFSTLVDDATASLWAHAVNTQLREHIAPAWRREPMHVGFARSGDEASGADEDPQAYVIALFDHAEQQGALGWHDVTPAGDPYGRVFIQDCIDAGVEPSTCLSHEVAEAFVDPDCNVMADVPAHGVEVALEVGDPVESFAYNVDVSRGDAHHSVAVSDFVTPEWFDPNAKEGPFDHMQVLVEPFEIGSGGYAIVRAVDAEYDSVWGQIPDAKLLTKLQPASRSNRLGLGIALQAWNDEVAKAAEPEGGTDAARGTIETGHGQAEPGEMPEAEQAWNDEEATPYQHPEDFPARIDGENYEQYLSRAAEWNRSLPVPPQVVPVSEDEWWALEIEPRP